VTTAGDTDGTATSTVFVPGARSRSGTRTGALVFDSGAELEQLLAKRLLPDDSTRITRNDSFDNRSDNKGPDRRA
jgi:hypothetical protein